MNEAGKQDLATFKGKQGLIPGCRGSGPVCLSHTSEFFPVLQSLDIFGFCVLMGLKGWKIVKRTILSRFQGQFRHSGE
ncbi:MAG: hypothetical protein K9J81_11805, partial [Desulfohalobiaceae bacterium]|nr:hypothetical protein [Desulfohalobiaceae bacterium]